MKRNTKRRSSGCEQLDRHRESLAQQGFKGDALKRLMDPLMSFHLQLQEEVETYEQLKRGELGGELTSLRSLGHSLICLRIAADVSQAELAKRLDVDPSQVSRDERNEYHGITIDRAAKIIDALGAKLQLRFELERKEPVGA
jgi:hypothetical protein